jgi:hypothetical protein
VCKCAHSDQHADQYPDRNPYLYGDQSTNEHGDADDHADSDSNHDADDHADSDSNHDAERAILVSSKYHTRRVRAIWHAAVGKKPEATVRFAYEDPYDPARWWQNTQDAVQAIRENLGLLNMWAGFPLQPERRM